MEKELMGFLAPGVVIDVIFGLIYWRFLVFSRTKVVVRSLDGRRQSIHRISMSGRPCSGGGERGAYRSNGNVAAVSVFP